MAPPSFGAVATTGSAVWEGSVAVLTRSNPIDEAAGVEQAARVELLFDAAHQPEVVARPAPDRQRALPFRGAVGQNQVSLRRRRDFGEVFQHRGGAAGRQVA